LVRSCVVAHSSTFNKKPAPKVGFSQPRLLHIFIEKPTQFETKKSGGQNCVFCIFVTPISTLANCKRSPPRSTSECCGDRLHSALIKTSLDIDFEHEGLLKPSQALMMRAFVSAEKCFGTFHE
jgi:hypothetical protein